MTTMTKDDIDWKTFAKALLWNRIVYEKNEYSGYDLITDNIPAWGKGMTQEQLYPRGYKPGMIVGNTDILSYYIGPIKKLSYKDLAIELGLGEEFGLIWDGHVCKGCPKEKTCYAFFKYDGDHEKCNWWSENMVKPNDDEKDDKDKPDEKDSES